MTAVMKELADGHLDIQIPSAGRKDEIGSMAQAVDVFRRNAVEAERMRALRERPDERIADNCQRITRKDDRRDQRHQYQNRQKPRANPPIPAA